MRIARGAPEPVNFEKGSFIVYDNDEDTDYSIHWHSPAEIIMPFEGWYEVVCAGAEYVLQAGDILVIAPGTLHRIHAPEQGRRMIFQVDFSFLYHLPEFELINTIIAPARCVTSKNAPDSHPKIRKCMEDIFHEYFRYNTFSGLSIYAQVAQILALIGKAFSHPSALMNGARISMNRYNQFIVLLDYINQHYTEKLTLESLSDMMGFSKFHFARLFKQITGISFHKYLNQKRIAAASQLLTDMDLSIADVAEHSGFRTLSSFMRMFKLLKSCTPTEYRKKMREP